MTEQPRGGKDELSATLLTLRRAAELSTRRVPGFTASKVSRIERGLTVPTETDVAALADVYRAKPAVRRRLLELARDIRAEHRPVVMARSRPGVFQQRLGRIEAASATVRSFVLVGVPGLLQTPAYARSIIANRHLLQEEEDEFVRARIGRADLLREPGREFRVIMTEAGLGWRLGSRADMAAQADHIAEILDLPTLAFGIIPWGTRADRLVLHSWDIYDQRAVSYGTGDATAIITEPRDVQRYLDLWSMLEQIAVWGDDARAVLARVADDYRRGSER